MAATVGCASLVEVPAVQQSGHSILTSRAAPVNANARQVELRVLLCGGFEPSYVIRCATVLEVLVAYVVEDLTSPVGSHTINLHDFKCKHKERDWL